MPQVKVIQPVWEQEKKLRVAAYVRVSSDSEDQLNSFAVQMEYYTKTIRADEEWEFAGIYADEGITGTSADKREAFQRLLRDCRAGKIERILVKSVSRFARNSADTIAAVRELRALGVSVYFEEQHLDTGNMGSEMLLSMMGAVAQEESLSISRNLKWGIRKRMSKGEYVTSSAPYGYSYVNRSLEINKKEAAVIRYIFSEYLNGKGIEKIVDDLNRQPETRSAHIAEWNNKHLHYILTNEKYMGDSLLQKTYTPDTLPLKSVVNHGDIAQYYIENSHPPIIEKEVFVRVQQLLSTKRSKATPKTTQYPFSKKLYCSICNSPFKRKVRTLGGIAWGCAKHYKSKENCPMKPVSEAEVHRAFCFLYNKLLLHQQRLFVPLLADLQEAQAQLQRSHTNSAKLHRELAAILKQNHSLAQLQRKGVIAAAICLERQNVLNHKIMLVQKEISSFQYNDRLSPVIEQTKAMIQSLENAAPLAMFDEDCFRALVERVVICEDAFIFYLRNGLCLREKRGTL